MKRTIFNKAFMSNVRVDDVNYIIRQNRDTQALTIATKKTQTPIYTYRSFDETGGTLLKYDSQNEMLIRKIFKKANIDRYVL